MTPHEFLEAVVKPNMAELNIDTGDIRAAFNAVASVDALAARIYWWGVNQEPPVMEQLKGDDDAYRKRLEGLNDDFRLLCDIARAFKHVQLRQKTPRLIYLASEISPQTLMVDDMEDFDRDWTEAPCVLIQGDNYRPLVVSKPMRSCACSTNERCGRVRLNSWRCMTI